MTHPTKAISPILLEDFRRISVDKKGEQNFFSSQMIKDCMKKVVTVNLHQTVKVLFTPVEEPSTVCVMYFITTPLHRMTVDEKMGFTKRYFLHYSQPQINNFAMELEYNFYQWRIPGVMYLCSKC